MGMEDGEWENVFMNLFILIDFRFEIPDSRMLEVVVFSNALESGMVGIWNRIQTRTTGL
jgi:hypothetical protein